MRPAQTSLTGLILVQTSPCGLQTDPHESTSHTGLTPISPGPLGQDQDSSSWSHPSQRLVSHQCRTVPELLPDASRLLRSTGPTLLSLPAVSHSHQSVYGSSWWWELRTAIFTILTSGRWIPDYSLLPQEGVGSSLPLSLYRSHSHQSVSHSSFSLFISHPPL